MVSTVGEHHSVIAVPSSELVSPPWQHGSIRMCLQAASVILIHEAVIEQEMVTGEKQCCVRCHSDSLGSFTKTQQRSGAKGNPCPAQVVLPVRTNHHPPLLWQGPIVINFPQVVVWFLQRTISLTWLRGRSCGFSPGSASISATRMNPLSKLSRWGGKKINWHLPSGT